MLPVDIQTEAKATSFIVIHGARALTLGSTCSHFDIELQAAPPKQVVSCMASLSRIFAMDIPALATSEEGLSFNTNVTQKINCDDAALGCCLPPARCRKRSYVWTKAEAQAHASPLPPACDCLTEERACKSRALFLLGRCPVCRSCSNRPKRSSINPRPSRMPATRDSEHHSLFLPTRLPSQKLIYLTSCASRGY